MKELTTVLDLIESGGVIGVLLFGVWGFLTGKVVPGWLYRQERAEKDEAVKALRESLEINKRLVRR